jgi:hypothetical protein
MVTKGQLGSSAIKVVVLARRLSVLLSANPAWAKPELTPSTHA